MRKLTSQKPWRDSASLIIAAPKSFENFSKKASSDFNILYLKRVAKSTFPNANVFPGGILDEADKSNKWIDIFKSVDSKFCENVGKEFFVRHNDVKRSPLFPGDEESFKRGILPNEIAFRICAIRESFEESGLLLLASDVEKRRNFPDRIHATSLTSLLDQDVVEDWRTKIHNDAYEFLNLCKELKKVPDIWSLKEWFHWLSPSHIKKRYNTVFYACCLKETPSYFAHDEVETTDSVWRTPEDMLQMHFSGEGFLSPPQLFETLKLLNFQSLRSFSTHINERALKGMRVSMAYFFLSKDGGVAQILPGDDLYPEEVDEIELMKNKVSNLTREELESSTGKKFRILLGGNDKNKTPKLLCNTNLGYGQVSPVIFGNGEIPYTFSAKL